MSPWFVYIVSNNAHTLYCGMARDIISRMRQHRNREYPNGFTARYTFDRLVYLEAVDSKATAARRERQIKSWRREKKVALIQAMNPNWRDLSLSVSEALLLR